jgi:GT2 family glycosyltransferase
MNKKKISVSIVVLNWNGQRFIDPFMKSYDKLVCKNADLRLYFVDNGSTDGSVEYFEKMYENDEDIYVIKNGANYGYSQGNNLGMLKVKGDYVLVCNNDLELDANLVEELLTGIVGNDADVAVPKLMFKNKPGYINNAGTTLIPNQPWPFKEVGVDEKDTGQYDEDRKITAFCGACVMFKRSFLEEVGLFDRSFFMYFEDLDLSWRGQKAGKKYAYCHKAVAYHVHTGSSTEWSPLFIHYVGRNRLLVLTKNAKLKVLAKAWAITLHDHLYVRLKAIFSALVGRYPKRRALKELKISLKMLWASLYYTPYALAKRWGMIKENHL